MGQRALIKMTCSWRFGLESKKLSELVVVFTNTANYWVGFFFWKLGSRREGTRLKCEYFPCLLGLLESCPKRSVSIFKPDKGKRKQCSLHLQLAKHLTDIVSFNFSGKARNAIFNFEARQWELSEAK